jgi:serine/threonine protein kinase
VWRVVPGTSGHPQRAVHAGPRSGSEGMASLIQYENEIRILKMLNGEYSKRFPECLSYWKSTSKVECYVVFERCSYGSLREFTQHLRQREKNLTELEILFFLREILVGVSIMQKLKMVHHE